MSPARRLVLSSIVCAVALAGSLIAASADGQEPSASDPSRRAADPSTPLTVADDAGALAAPVVPPAAPATDGGAPAADAATPPRNDALGTARADLVRFRYANTWDLNLEGGGGYVFGDTDKATGFVRARPGVLLVRNDDFYQFGATAEYLGMLKRPAFGLQAEYLHLQLGAWMQLGGSIDTKGRPGGMASLGLSIFGVEGQVREFDASSDPAFVLIGKIRLPLGILIYGLRTRK